MRGRGDMGGLVGQSLAGGTAPAGTGHSLAGLTALGNPPSEHPGDFSN